MVHRIDDGGSRRRRNTRTRPLERHISLPFPFRPVSRFGCAPRPQALTALGAAAQRCCVHQHTVPGVVLLLLFLSLLQLGNSVGAKAWLWEPLPPTTTVAVAVPMWTSAIPTDSASACTTLLLDAQ